MILLNILKKKRKFKNLFIEKEYKNRLVKFSNTLLNLKNTQKTGVGNGLEKNSNLTIKKKLNDYVNYIINISITLTNTIVSVTDIKGNVLISMSSGNVNLTSKQKKQQPLALINLFKALIIKAKFLKDKPVALHFKNTKIFYETLVINLLKNKYYIVSIHSYNLSPHNGCRPKKLKRTKFRTKRRVLR